MIIEDEHGWHWSIQNGDPAAPAVARLTRLGFRRIVLSRRTIIDALPTVGPTLGVLEDLARAYRDLGEQAIAEVFLRQANLYDVCKTLACRPS